MIPAGLALALAAGAAYALLWVPGVARGAVSSKWLYLPALFAHQSSSSLEQVGEELSKARAGVGASASELVVAPPQFWLRQDFPTLLDLLPLLAVSSLVGVVLSRFLHVADLEVSF